MTYTPHRPMLEHQAAEFEISKDLEYRALFWEMRCMKTKVILDTFAYNYAIGRVTALVVIAFPNGAHLVWRDEIQKDFSLDLLDRTKVLAWSSGKMKTKTKQEELAALLAHKDGPTVLTLNCEAIIVDSTWKYLRKFFTVHRVLLASDEDWATNWSARTQRLLAMGRGKTTVMRRIISGTPADEGPLDLYFPCQFLKPGLLGFTSKQAFRNRYTEYEYEEGKTDEFGNPVRRKGFNRRTQTEFDIIKGWRRLDELQAKLATFSSRVLRKDISDAPEKVHQFRYFQLTPKQRAVYDRLRDRYTIEIRDGQYDARNVLLRMTRLQMIARNFWPPTDRGDRCRPCGGLGFLDDGSECEACQGIGIVVTTSAFERIDPDRNPSLDALTDVLYRARTPAVVWCRFRQEVEDITPALVPVLPRVSAYYGGMTAASREDAYQAFRSGDLDVIVATESSGLSRSKDLTRARTLVYYSNEFALRTRRQSEDRAEGVLREESTDIIDLVAENTRDMDVIESLRAKRSIAQQITGDAIDKWI